MKKYKKEKSLDIGFDMNKDKASVTARCTIVIYKSKVENIMYSEENGSYLHCWVKYFENSKFRAFLVGKYTADWGNTNTQPPHLKASSVKFDWYVLLICSVKHAPTIHLGMGKTRKCWFKLHNNFKDSLLVPRYHKKIHREKEYRDFSMTQY